MDLIIALCIFLFFFLDVVLIGFFNYQYVHMLLGLYCATRMRTARAVVIEIMLIIFLLLEQFMLDDMFGIHLIYLLPLMLFIHGVQPFFRSDSAVLPYACLVAILGAKFLFTLLLKGAHAYIFYELCVNIGIVLLILKYIVKGRLDNRLCA